MRIENGLRGLAEHLDDPAGQAVLALGPLVRVGVGAHGDVVPAPTGCGAQLGPQPLDRVDLHHDRAGRSPRRVEPQVLVRRPGEAVVADHAVGDEVAGAGRDVVHRDLDAEIARSTRHEVASLFIADPSMLPLAGDRRIDRVEEPQPLPETTEEANRDERPVSFVPLDREPEVEAPEAVVIWSMISWSLVEDSQDPAAAAPLGIEDAGQESLVPLLGRHGSATRSPARWHRPLARAELRIARIGRRRAVRARNSNSTVGTPIASRKSLRSVQRLDVGQCQAEAVHVAVRPTRPLVRVVTDVAVAADHPAEVAAAVVVVVLRAGSRTGRCRAACCSSSGAAAASGHCSVPVTCFQPRSGQEAVVAAGDELRAVLERDPVGGLDRRPVVEHRR